MNLVIEEIHKACRIGDTELLSALITSHPDLLNSNDNKLGWCCLYRSVVCNQISSVNILLRQGADVNIQNRLGETPLHQAVCNNFLKIAQALLESGASPNISQNDGETPLHHACMKGNAEMVELLLKYHADPTIPNTVMYKTPVDYALDYNHTDILQLLHQRKNKSCLCTTEEPSNTSKESIYEPESEKTSRLANPISSQLFAWLCNKKLEAVHEVLLQNGYDDLKMLVSQMQSSLPLTEENLKSIGIAKPGYRLRLLASLEEEANKRKRKNVAGSKSLATITWCSTAPLSPGVAFAPNLLDFLDGLGLRQFYQRFSEAGLEEFEQLTFLMSSNYPITDEFLLKEIHMEKIGYRHRILSKLNEEVGVVGKNTLRIEKDYVKSACECTVM